MTRHSLFSILSALLLVSQSAVADIANTSSATWAALKQGGHIVVFRHANALGNGDPGKVTIGDCSTQRNLDAAGREQSVQIGEQFRLQAIAIDQVWSSQWCRTRDTATLAFGAAKVKDEPAFNSFFANPSAGPQQSESAKRLLLAWQGTSNLVVVTHQVNVTQLTGVYPVSGEGVVLKRDGKTLRVVGKIAP
jgi:phosphohistidine phosphatase SixA